MHTETSSSVGRLQGRAADRQIPLGSTAQGQLLAGVLRSFTLTARFRAVALVLIALTLAGVRPAIAQTETVLHSFTGQDGSLPGPRLTMDSAGNLYGSTVGNSGFIGSIFKLSPSGQLKVLYKFSDSSRLFTTGKLVLLNGNLFGVDQTGGTSGNGSIFRLTQSGVFTVLYSFTGKSDGAFPNGVIADAQGNLYGTTNLGGASGQGTVFKFTPGHGVTVLYTFTGQSDGGEPFDAALYRDSQGNLYGTTMFDGGIISLGVVFKVSPQGAETVLHTFEGGASDGGRPKGSLISDGKGNLYGTTSSGEGLQGGTVFRITTSGVFTQLHLFSGSDGYSPDPGLAMDSQGDLYGTTFSGGTSNDGVVFEINAADAESVLHNFSGSDGATPYAGLIINSQSDLFGTTGFGGASNQGTVFEVVP